MPKREENLPFEIEAWFGEDGLRLCSLAAKGLWIDLLCYMWRGEQRGQLRLGGQPMGPTDIAGMEGVKPEDIIPLLEELEGKHVLAKLADGTIINRRMVRRAEAEKRLSGIRAFAGTKGMAKRWGGQEPRTGNPQTLENREIFNSWNEAGIIRHRTMTAAMARAIQASLQVYGKAEIAAAIATYAEILHSEDFWWSYRWTLKDFLQRGLDKFMDGAVARKNYAKKPGEKGPYGTPRSRTKGIDDLKLPGD